jgi:hypothetical protein
VFALAGKINNVGLMKYRWEPHSGSHFEIGGGIRNGRNSKLYRQDGPQEAALQKKS